VLLFNCPSTISRKEVSEKRIRLHFLEIKELDPNIIDALDPWHFKKRMHQR